MQQQSSDSTFKPALMLMTGRALAFAVTFFVPAVLARVFTQTEFGTYKQFMLITYTLFSFGQFGLAECLFYFMPGRPERAGGYAFNSVVMLGFMGIVFSSVLLFNAQGVAHWLNNDALAGYAPLTALYLIFMLMGAVLEIAMITRKRFKLATATYVMSDVLRAVFLMLPALLTHSLAWTFIGGVTFCLFRVLWFFRYFFTEFEPGIRLDASLLREQFAYALPFFCAVMVHIIQQNYHQYAVSWHFDAATFAIYSVGCLNIPLVDFMATPASNVMMVQMGDNLRQGRPERLLGIWRETTRKLAFVFFPLVGLLIVNAYHLITLLYTSRYAASVPIFMVWSLSILFSAFQTDGVLRTFAENKYLLIINLIRLTAIVALMNWFFAGFHLQGPVLLTITGILMAKAMSVVRIKKLLNTNYAQVLPWKTLGLVSFISMVSAVPAIVVNAKLSLPALVVLPIAGMAYVVTYAVLMLVLGVLDENEKASLKRLALAWTRTPMQAPRQAGVGGRAA
jgi:O-antigen/teichoic acid export membrane protein